MRTFGTTRRLLLAGLAAAACLAASAAERPPLELTVRTPTPKVRCGEPLTVQVELRNTGAQEVRVYLRDLRLDANRSLPLGPVAGRARVVEEPGREPWFSHAIGSAPAGTVHRYVRIDPGASALFETVDPQATARELGRIKCSYRLYGDDPGLRNLLSLPASADVQFEVLPSRLMISVWKARSPAAVRRALPEFLDLLRATGGRDRGEYVRTTLTYMASSALPLLDLALQDTDPAVRACALSAYSYTVWAVRNMDSIRARYGLSSGPLVLWTPRGPNLGPLLHRLELVRNAPSWARLLPEGNAQQVRRALLVRAGEALEDPSALVRAQAVRVLGGQKAEGFLARVKDLATDPSPEVRGAVVQYMQVFVSLPEASTSVAEMAVDPDVRGEALRSLETSNALPFAQALADLFRRVHGEEGVRLIALLRQQEDEGLPWELEPGFAERTPDEREAILTAVAGHADEPTLRLVRLGLSAPEPAVQRAALLRLLQFPAEKGLAALDASRAALSQDVTVLAATVRGELTDRRVFPFLARPAGPWAVAPQQTFPSQNGTLPMVSPDGQWVAYQETGWGRPGGTGGTGRSNLLSLVHAVRSDGTGDRILSDMFLRGWLADSRRVASARDNCAAIANLAGRVVAEFGEPYVDRSRLPPGTPADWRDRDMRSQMGFGSMPHSRALFPLRLGQDEHGEGAAFSPDGAWFGPLDAVGSGLFLGADGARRQMQQGGGGLHQMGHFAIWAPAADRVALVSGMSLSVLDFRDMTVRAVTAIDPLTVDGHAGAPTWTPWDREGRHLTFVRGGQVWVSDVDGNEAHQLTFDSTSKRFPVFSPDGSRIAYIVWQPDKRQYWEAPTDVWVVDVRTALAVRVTEPDAGRIGGLDWLDGEHLIYDRLVRPAPLVFSSTLRTADLARRADQ